MTVPVALKELKKVFSFGCGERVSDEQLTVVFALHALTWMFEIQKYRVKFVWVDVLCVPARVVIFRLGFGGDEASVNPHCFASGNAKLIQGFQQAAQQVYAAGAGGVSGVKF